MRLEKRPTILARSKAGCKFCCNFLFQI